MATPFPYEQLPPALEDLAGEQQKAFPEAVTFQDIVRRVLDGEIEGPMTVFIPPDRHLGRLTFDDVVSRVIDGNREAPMIVWAGENETPIPLRLVEVDEPSDSYAILKRVEGDRDYSSVIELFTPREQDVFMLMARGLSNTDIAKQLGLGYETIKSHVSNILGKMDASTRLQATSIALEHEIPGVITQPQAVLDNLSPRQLDITGLITLGYSYSEIADRLFIEVTTVKDHLKKIYRKLGVSNRIEACVVGRRERILDLAQQAQGYSGYTGEIFAGTKAALAELQASSEQKQVG